MCDFTPHLVEMEEQAQRELGEVATRSEVEAHERQIAEDLADFDARIAALIGAANERVPVASGR